MADIKEVMQSLPFFHPANGVDEESINDAEEQLGVTFSKEFRDYVKAFGDASANGHEITGITDNKRLDVVSVTLAERTRNPTIPIELYVVEQTGVDRIVIWQDASGSIYQTIPGGNLEKIFDSLSDFVAQ